MCGLDALGYWGGYNMSEPLEPKWIVLRRSNGHAETLGSIIPLHETEAAARDEALSQSGKHNGIKFCVCAVIAEYSAEVQTIVRETGKAKK